MRITRVYTRTGDKGETGLVGGSRVRKDAVRIEAVGTVDETNAAVGLARTFLIQLPTEDARTRLDGMLRRIQNDLFDVGADLATPAAHRWASMRRVGDEDVTRLEQWIDALNEDVGPLMEFVLPGGGPVNAFLHQARTVCRRAERVTTTLMDDEPDAIGAMRYLNRLSDFLFVAARWAGKCAGEREYLWEK